MNETMSRTRRALGLRAYLNLALAVTVVIFALAGAFTYTQVESRIKADVEEHLDSLATHLAGDTIATWLEQKRGLAKALAAYPAMREMQVAEAQRIINATYAAAPADYNNIGFFDATGLMVADIAGAAGKGNLIKGNPWGQEVYDGRRTQSPELISSLNNRPIFVLYERVRDASGAVVGVVGVGTDLTAIGDRLEELKIGQTGEAVLVNSQGLVLNKLRDTPDSVLTLDLSQDRLTQLALSGQAGIVEMSDYRGVPVVAAYRPLPEYGWGIVVKQNADEAFAVLARLRAVFFGVMAGALAVALVSNLIVQRRVSLALRRLIAGSQRLAAGELATPIEPLAISEFGHLADEFNRMAAALSEKEARLRGNAQELEQRVQERTADLLATNEALSVEVAERKRVEETQRRLTSILEATTDFVGSADVSGRLIYLNRAGRQMLGIGLDEDISNLTIPDVIAESERERVMTEVIPLLMRDGVWSGETAFRSRDGLEIPFWLVGIAGKKPDGTVESLSTIARDFREPKRAEAEILRRNRELSVLYTISRAAAQSLDLEQTLDNALEATLAALEIEAGGLLLLEPGGETLTLRVHRGLSEEFIKATQSVGIGEGLSGRAVAEKTLMVLDVPDYPPGRLSPLVIREGYQTMASAPLLSAGEVVGSMSLGTRRARAFPPEERDLLMTVGRILGSAVQNARLYEAVQHELAERRQIEARLQEAETRYRSLFEQSPDGVLIVDPETAQAIEFNDAAHSQLGYARDEFARLHTPDYEASEKPEETAAHIEKILRQGRDDFETVHRTKAGEIRNVLVTVQMIELSSRPYLYAVFHDITERKRAEAAIQTLNADLERRAAELEAANKELEAFTYSVSHDLRAPLRHVIGFTDLLQAGAASGLDEKSRRYLTTITQSAKRMGMLIDDLLAFSRVGRAEMESGAVNLEQTVQEALRELRPEIEGRDIVWKIAPLPEVRGDSSMLRLAWVNLIANAVKYTRTRTRAEIEIGCDSGQDHETVFFIRDNGVGFDMKYVDKLFGVFQRLHRASEFEGTGIGLANVRRIVHRHGGRTWAEGAVEGGATFYFSLPQSTREELP